MAIQILIADDHVLLRQGIKKVLDLEPDLKVIEEAADGQEALAKRWLRDLIFCFWT